MERMELPNSERYIIFLYIIEELYFTYRRQVASGRPDSSQLLQSSSSSSSPFFPPSPPSTPPHTTPTMPEQCSLNGFFMPAEFPEFENGSGAAQRLLIFTNTIAKTALKAASRLRQIIQQIARSTSTVPNFPARNALGNATTFFQTRVLFHNKVNHDFFPPPLSPDFLSERHWELLPHFSRTVLIFTTQ